MFKFTVYLIYKLHVYFDVLVTCYFDGSFDTKKVIRLGKKQKKNASHSTINTRILNIFRFTFF